MNSMTLMRLFVAKTGNNSLITRQLSMHSMNCMKRNSQKLLSNSFCYNNNKQTVAKQQLPNNLSISRLMATAVDQKGAHNHSKLWSLERYVSFGLLGIIPAAFVIPVPAMDYLLALSLVTHIHWGFEAIVVDYIRPNLFGQVVPKLALGSVYLLSVLTLGGLFYFNYTDVGIVTALRMLAKM